MEIPKWQTRFLQIMSLVVLAMTLYVNYLSNALPLNGRTAKMISDQYANFFTPAPFTFLIWIVIYIGLTAYTFWQLGSIFNKTSASKVDLIVNRIGLLFIFTGIFNMAWLFAWHHDNLFLSVMLMIGLLLTLFEINKRIYLLIPNTSQMRLLVKFPFGLYFGWISIALIANVAAYLIKTEWNAWGIDPRIWTFILIVVGAVLAYRVIKQFNSIGYGMAVLWGLIGIFVMHIGDSVQSITIMLTIIVSMIVLFVMILRRFDRWSTV